MTRTIRHRLGNTLIGISAAAALVGCAGDTPLGLDRRPAASATFATVQGAAFSRAPDLTSCDSLQVQAGSRLATRLYARGVQIYRWNGTSWVFVAPSALLYADPEGRGQVGSHYAGPSWESMSGSKVVGTVLRRCTPDASAIPWLLLGSVSSDGPGIFHDTKFIQRVNTTGGLAPLEPGSVTGETTSVPYRAEYLFYRAA